MAKQDNKIVTLSSGNVFADLKLPNAEELQTKVRLAASINAILTRRRLTQVQAARVLGVNQPKVSALKGYKLEGFSVGRLMRFVTALEHDLVIEIRPHTKAKGAAARIQVVVAA
jgi:predicted XRE-type DNA-binding protein